jgi:hypothetical protein
MKMLFGGFAPPAARQTTAVFFMVFRERITRIFLTLKENIKEKTPLFNIIPV